MGESALFKADIRLIFLKPVGVHEIIIEFHARFFRERGDPFDIFQSHDLREVDVVREVVVQSPIAIDAQRLPIARPHRLFSDIGLEGTGKISESAESVDDGQGLETGSFFKGRLRKTEGIAFETIACRGKFYAAPHFPSDEYGLSLPAPRQSPVDRPIFERGALDIKRERRRNEDSFFKGFFPRRIRHFDEEIFAPISKGQFFPFPVLFQSAKPERPRGQNMRFALPFEVEDEFVPARQDGGFARTAVDKNHLSRFIEQTSVKISQFNRFHLSLLSSCFLLPIFG